MSLSSGEAMTDQVSQVELARINIREGVDVIDEGTLERKVSAIVGSNRCWGLQSGVMYAEPFRQIRIQERHSTTLAYLPD